MPLARICACMMWFIVWKLNGANSQLTVEIRQYTSSAKTEYNTLRTYSDPSGTPPFLDWFTSRQVNIPDLYNTSSGRGFESFQPDGGINGFLYYPTPHNACSEVDTPPAINNTNTVWLAIVGDYPSCTPENIMFLNTAGYRVMITYSDGDTNRVPPSGTDFPVAIVTEEFANYLIRNVTVNSTDGLITVHISNNSQRQIVIAVCIVVALILAALLVLYCLYKAFCKSDKHKRKKRNVSGYRNRNTTLQQQRSRETIQLRQHQRNLQQEGQRVEVTRQSLQLEEEQVNTMADVQQLFQVRNSEEQHPAGQLQPQEVMQRQVQTTGNRSRQEIQQQIDVNGHQETLHQQSEPTIYQNVRTSVRGRRAYNMQTDAFRSCPICLDDFTDGETVRVLPCDQDHIFHLRCVNQWLRQHQECPVCRENVIDREGTAQPEERQLLVSAQQQQHVRPTVARLSERARQSQPETRQQPAAPQQRRQEEEGRQRSDNQQRGIPRLLPREATQQSTSNNQRVQSTAEPLYGNIRSTFCGRQFNVQTEPCKTCSICLVDFSNGETVRVLPCDPDHIFHAACVQLWITTHRKCPVCRKKVVDRATQQSTSNSQQQAQPLYGNVRTSFLCRQFTIQTESCKACSICLVDFDDGETVRILPCDSDHIFHAACVQPWINTHGQCPVCRVNVTDTSSV